MDERSLGIGLKPQHVGEILAGRPRVDFFEVHAENYMVDGGPLHRNLERIAERYPLSLHGVGLSIGGESPIDEAHLDRLASLIARYRPALFSEHLAWSSHGGTFLNDLLPLPYDDETLARVCRHIDRVQERLGTRMLLENPSTYLEFERSKLDEAQFLSEVVRSTGCGLLLDVNNAYVSCVNRGCDPLRFIESLPLQAVGQFHLAGFTRDADALGAPLLIDSHGSAVDDAVWNLYRAVLARIGPRPTLIEWDNDVPQLSTWLGECDTARRYTAALAVREEAVP